ncbi:Phosphoethanolamine N-methyltransferase 1 [Phytophthora megakarya]|uniref:Phosphoethanolamine N-methyltransferase 1 n=1 Tax=Phytophthora megakarya TaxID=4795 RepID=A0A225WM98_9STRA|nr:Phosphoethanolamine N-methyltransferase 1 [Phytophthora megakarya]
MTKDEEIKTMKLYRHLDRIERRLKEAGYINKDVTVDPEKLGTLDSLHFFGDEPICHLIKLLGATPDKKKVLDIGAGFGGTARLLAHRSGCKVDALELQPDLSETGRELTRRCRLNEHVTHVNGDFLELPVRPNEYDAVVGLLSFLHIGHWLQLFQRCYDSLKPGGVLYVDDFFLRGDKLTEEDQLTLQQDVYCADLLPLEEIQSVVRACGYETPKIEDVTSKWQPYVSERATQYHANLETHIARDGEATALGLDHFYTRVADLFQAGNVGGYTLVVRKPL